MRGSYHNHTSWSDGLGALPDWMESARREGLEELGFSDHLALLPDGSGAYWSMPPERLGDYVDAVLGAADAAGSPRIRLGIEADYFPETAGRLAAELAAFPFDYVIGSVHVLDGFPVDQRPRDWEGLGPDQVDERWRQYWVRVRAMAESGLFDLVGHLDLPKKFGFLPEASLREEEEAALDAITSAGMAIEINASGWFHPAAEAFPSLRLLRLARARRIPVVPTADAHRPEDVARGLERASDLAREAGYGRIVRFEARRRVPVPL